MCWVGLWHSLLFHLCVAPYLEGRISFFERCCSSSSTHRGSLAFKQDSSLSREVSVISLNQEEPSENLCLLQVFTFEKHSQQFQIVLLPIHGHINKWSHSKPAFWEWQSFFPVCFLPLIPWFPWMQSVGLSSVPFLQGQPGCPMLSSQSKKGVCHATGGWRPQS